MTVLETPQSRCQCGFARRDITPPIGIYHRMWGAAVHDQATGIHRPLNVTVLLMRAADGSDDHIWVALDHCLFWHREMDEFVAAVCDGTGTDARRLTVVFSHTHAAGLMGAEREALPGGNLIRGYMDDVKQKTIAAIDQAKADCRPATIVYGETTCELAANRDFFDETTGQYVCGFNPSGTADRRVLVARVTDQEGNTMGTIVNYACHPTTLAWENTMISPDFPGALREVVEREFAGPCIFLQGASGDVGPVEGFVGDLEVADRNGRQLGFAALSALTALPAAGQRFVYAGAVVSGATIGTWEHQPLPSDRLREQTAWQRIGDHVALPYRDDLPCRENLEAELSRWRVEEQRAIDAGDEHQARNARAMQERQTRRLTRIDALPAGDVFPLEVNVWRFGDAIWLAVEGEHYNVFQRSLRERFPRIPIVIMTLAGGSRCWYLPAEDAYGKGLYQEAASVLKKGSLETLIAASIRLIEKALGHEDHQD